MTAIYAAPEPGWIPDNDFGDRLAQVRSRMGWNYSEAGDACGIDGEAWSRWELEGSRPQHYELVCRTISTVTKCDLVWLSTGRSSSNVLPPQRLKRRQRRIVAYQSDAGKAFRVRKALRANHSVDAEPLAAEINSGAEGVGPAGLEPATYGLLVRLDRRRRSRRAHEESMPPPWRGREILVNPAA